MLQMLWITFHIIIRARAPEENQHKQSVMTSPRSAFLRPFGSKTRGRAAALLSKEPLLPL